jgi:hypothetical protein
LQLECETNSEPSCARWRSAPHRAQAQGSNKPGPNPGRNAHEINLHCLTYTSFPPRRLPIPARPLPPPPARLAAALARAPNPSRSHCPVLCRVKHLMEGGGSGAAAYAMRSPEEVFRDHRARRAGMIKALTTGTRASPPSIGLPNYVDSCD